MGVGKIRHAVTANSASPIKSVRLNIADCRKNRAGDFSFKEVSCVSGTHVAETDHTESYFIHCCLRFKYLIQLKLLYNSGVNFASNSVKK